MPIRRQENTDSRSMTCYPCYAAPLFFLLLFCVDRFLTFGGMGIPTSVIPMCCSNSDVAMTFFTRKWSINEKIHNVQPHPGEEHSRIQHIFIVMQPRTFGGKAIPVQGAVDTRYLISSNGNADAGATDDDAFFALARCHGMGHHLTIDGIIQRGVEFTPEVLAFQSAILQVGQNLLLEFVSTMVTADSDHLTQVSSRQRRWRRCAGRTAPAGPRRGRSGRRRPSHPHGAFWWDTARPARRPRPRPDHPGCCAPRR